MEGVGLVLPTDVVQYIRLWGFSGTSSSRYISASYMTNNQPPQGNQLLVRAGFCGPAGGLGFRVYALWFEAAVCRTHLKAARQLYRHAWCGTCAVNRPLRPWCPPTNADRQASGVRCHLLNRHLRCLAHALHL